MRKLTTVLFGLLLAAGLATSASALSVDPNPVSFSGGTEGSVSFDISGTTLTMEISITKGKLARSRVSVADGATGDNRGVVATGSLEGAGVNIRRIRVFGDGTVEFSFKSIFFHPHIHAGQTSDPHFIVFDSLAAGDVITFVGFRHNIFGSFASVQATIVPEPASAALVGLGLLGLAIAGRRRD
jgi:hypothetical protein